MTTPLAPTTTQTAREYLASLNPPLAKAGPGVRGRFSTAGVEALTAARAAGVVFADDVKVVKTTPAVAAPAQAAPAPVATPAPAPVATPAPAGTVNAKDARAWAKANGIAVGERGRLHPDVLNAYAAATGTSTTVKPTVSLVKAAPVQTEAPKVLRKQTVAYGRIARKEGDGPHITEPILAILDCYKCKSKVNACACKTGPRLPKWAGGTACAFDPTEV
jgi:hypothetical protein